MRQRTFRVSLQLFAISAVLGFLLYSGGVGFLLYLGPLGTVLGVYVLLKEVQEMVDSAQDVPV